MTTENFQPSCSNRRKIKFETDKDLIKLHKLMKADLNEDDITTTNCSLVLRSEIKKLDLKLHNNFMNEEDLIRILTSFSTNTKITESVYLNFKGNFENLAKSLNGSKFLQKALINTESWIVSLIFEELKACLPSITSHPHANYFCQKLFKYLTSSEKITFMRIIEGDFIKISSHSFGNYTIQNIIENLKTNEEEESFLKLILKENAVNEMIENFIGFFVLEKVICTFKQEKIQSIYDYVFRNFIRLCENKIYNGLIRNIMALSNYEYKMLIQKRILENFVFLINKTNSPILIALELWEDNLTDNIIKQFINNFVFYSTQKNPSISVEKCLERGGEEFADCFVEEIYKNKKVAFLMKNLHGSFVLLKAIQIARFDTKMFLVKCIMQNLKKMTDNKIIYNWEKICNSVFESMYNFNFK